MNNISPAATLLSRNYFLNESDFHNCLFQDIENIIKNMESSSDKYYCDDEDKLSHTIVTSLGHLGYKATEQTKKNGSVDITVSTKDNKFEWIAEAKIGYGHQKIFEGLLQLLTRYVKRDTSGGLIVYYQKAKSNTLFNNWLKYLYKQEWKDYCESQGNLDKVIPLLGHLNILSYKHIDNTCFQTNVKVVNPNGGDFDLRCFYVDIYHEPLDKSGMKNKSLKEGIARNMIKENYKLWEIESFNDSHYTELFTALKIYFDGALDD